jgi:hypothetical protein
MRRRRRTSTEWSRDERLEHKIKGRTIAWQSHQAR